jgi:hypothetical protein
LDHQACHLVIPDLTWWISLCCCSQDLQQRECPASPLERQAQACCQVSERIVHSYPLGLSCFVSHPVEWASRETV